jgi:anti-sigma regulatory factor (Ser/Thr protein kinase)
MDPERLSLRAATQRARSRDLRRRAVELREQSGHVTHDLVLTLGRSHFAPFGDRGDSFWLRLARLPAVLGLLRRDFRRWLEGRGVGADDTGEILIAFAEACANAVEHPRDAKRQAFEVDASTASDELRIAVRDFGAWSEPGDQADELRGRGLALIGSLMDEVAILEGSHGTRVTMRRRLGGRGPQGLGRATATST